MSSESFFHNIYIKKTNEELKTIATSDDYTSDAKLCAISVLKERNESPSDFHKIEIKQTENRDKKLESEIDNSRYRTGGSRILALFIDGLIISALSWILKQSYGINFHSSFSIIPFIELILPYAYHISMHGSCGQTVGKMIMDIKVYDVSESKDVTYTQALLRDIVPLSALVILHFLSYAVDIKEIGILMYISIVMSVTLVFWSILEIITMLFNHKRRAFHDFIAGTVVLKLH